MRSIVSRRRMAVRAIGSRVCCDFCHICAASLDRNTKLRSGIKNGRDAELFRDESKRSRRSYCFGIVARHRRAGSSIARPKRTNFGTPKRAFALRLDSHKSNKWKRYD